MNLGVQGLNARAAAAPEVTVRLARLADEPDDIAKFLERHAELER
ncbi:hypothetical protein GCM10009609_01590 [Pseudonocardia aurantiaca]|uniref:Uncharacterized protein n=1 Tax=Pseudonocardia aurantiaca TaxID=75290 RepID=A0ABW4FFV9_9PSEU